MTELTPIESKPLSRYDRLARRAAIGKAFLVYLGTGSVAAAVVALVLFKMMGC